MAPLRVAVIGFGNISREHVRGYEKAPDAQLVAVADSSPERRAEAEAAGLQAFADPRRLLQEVPVDVVSLCTPPSSHEELAELAFEHGAHVLCEKPIARRADEARRMIEAARRADRLLGVAFCHRFIPALRHLRELIASGTLGRPLLYRNQFSGPFLGVEKTWFADPEHSGGGTLMDTTVHSVDLFRYFFGEVEQVRALATISRDVLKVEDTAIMLVKAENGCLGTLEASWSVAPGTLHIEVRGTKGEAFYDYTTLRWRSAEAPEEWHVVSTAEGCDVRFAEEIRHFLEAVRGNAPLELTAENGLRAAELLEQAYASARG